MEDKQLAGHLRQYHLGEGGAAAIRGLNKSLEQFDTAQLRIPGGDSP